jgi:hypothetical protein
MNTIHLEQDVRWAGIWCPRDEQTPKPLLMTIYILVFTLHSSPLVGCDGFQHVLLTGLGDTVPFFDFFV